MGIVPCSMRAIERMERDVNDRLIERVCENTSIGVENKVLEVYALV